MMKQEFESLVGYEVTQEDYDKIIEPMYMATNLSKEDFVKCIDRKRFALPKRSKIESDIRKIANQIKSVCTHRCFYEEQDQMCELISNYIDRFFPDSRFYFEYSVIGGCHYPCKAVIYGNDCKTVTELELI